MVLLSGLLGMWLLKRQLNNGYISLVWLVYEYISTSYIKYSIICRYSKKRYDIAVFSLTEEY